MYLVLGMYYVSRYFLNVVYCTLTSSTLCILESVSCIYLFLCDTRVTYNGKTFLSETSLKISAE